MDAIYAKGISCVCLQWIYLFLLNSHTIISVVHLHCCWLVHIASIWHHTRFNDAKSDLASSNYFSSSSSSSNERHYRTSSDIISFSSWLTRRNLSRGEKRRMWEMSAEAGAISFYGETCSIEQSIKNRFLWCARNIDMSEMSALLLIIYFFIA